MLLEEAKAFHTMAFLRGLGEKPTLSGLSYLLRHEDLWPPGFEWNFRYGDQCAMGLASRVWPAYYPADEKLSVCTMRAFNLTRLRLMTIFISKAGKGLRSDGLFSRMSSVKPEQVADHIDRYISKQDVFA